MTQHAEGITAVRAFVSYSHDSAEHRENMADFAQQLRRAGIDAMIDHFVESEPPLSWPLWMNQQIDSSDFVLIVVTETYTRRFMHRETPGRGLGVRWEGALITSELYQARSERVKFIPVVVNSADAIYIPPPLRLTTWYEIGTIGHRNLEPLLRHLLQQPAIVPEPLGPVIELGSKGVRAEPAAAMESLQRRIEAAMARARTGDRDGAKGELEEFLDNVPKEIAASAAYNLGLLWQEEEAYSQSITAYERAIELLPGSPVAEAATNNLQIVLQSMNAHYGPDGPVHAAREWLLLIREGEIRQAWERVDRDARLALAQAWILANQSHPNLQGMERDDLAAELSQAKPTHPLARPFLATQLDEFERAYQAFDDETWGAAEKPRRFGLDLNLVIFMMTGGGTLIWEPGEAMPAIQLLMRRQFGQWYVAGFSRELPVPGWPPTTRSLPDSEV
ncbi:MAG TPA: TIR domain-containing protein [Actinomycetes bacterium]|nr:TIR domain-containing protein [Actinomycetes bacterium]